MHQKGKAGCYAVPVNGVALAVLFAWLLAQMDDQRSIAIPCAAQMSFLIRFSMRDAL